jgi:putative heme-binding domain-containing protein
MKPLIVKPWIVACSISFLFASSAAAQHTFSPADVDDGLRLFRANCVVCHGPDGDKISGVDLGHGKFRRAATNEDVENIIIAGVPGTAMPPHNFTEREAFSIVMYLRQMAAIADAPATGNGDPARGKAIYEGKGGCTSCHRVLGNGSRTGPDLSDVGALRRAAELERSLVDPNAEIHMSNRSFRAVTKNGTEITGRLLNEDTFSVQILDSQEHLRNLQRSDLQQAAILDKSPMPSYKDKLSATELADVVAYLSSLRGAEPK